MPTYFAYYKTQPIGGGTVSGVELAKAVNFNVAADIAAVKWPPSAYSVGLWLIVPQGVV